MKNNFHSFRFYIHVYDPFQIIFCARYQMKIKNTLWGILESLLKTNWLYAFGCISGLCILFHWSIYQFCTPPSLPCHCSYLISSKIWVLLTCSSFLQLLAIINSYTFWSHLVNFYRNAFSDFDCDYIESIDHLERRIDILTIISLLIHKHDKSLYLLRFF